MVCFEEGDYINQSIPPVKCVVWPHCLTRVVAGQTKCEADREK